MKADLHPHPFSPLPLFFAGRHPPFLRFAISTQRPFLHTLRRSPHGLSSIHGRLLASIDFHYPHSSIPLLPIYVFYPRVSISGYVLW